MLNDEALLDMAANLRRRDISLQVYFTHTLLILYSYFTHTLLRLLDMAANFATP